MKAMIFSISKYLTDTQTFWLFNIDLTDRHIHTQTFWLFNIDLSIYLFTYLIFFIYSFIYLVFIQPLGEAKVLAKKFKFVTTDVHKPFHYYIDSYIAQFSFKYQPNIEPILSKKNYKYCK